MTFTLLSVDTEKEEEEEEEEEEKIKDTGEIQPNGKIVDIRLCCLVLVYEAMELAHPCVFYPVTVHPSRCGRYYTNYIIHALPLSALFRQRGPRNATTRPTATRRNEKQSTM